MVWGCIIGGLFGGAGGLEFFFDELEDFVDGAFAFHSVIFAFGLVELLKRGGLRVIYFEAVGDGFGIVVGTSAFLATLYQTVEELGLAYLEAYDGMHFGATALKHFVKGLGLLDGAGETVEYHALGGLAVGVECMLEDFNHKVVGDELAFGDIVVGNAAQLGVAANVVAQQVAGGDMVKSVFFNHKCALGAFSTAGAPKTTKLYMAKTVFGI